MVLNRIPLLSSRFPFKNLVFQGGGVKSYVYHGVLRVLDEEGILSQIERVAGTSAGALQAMMLCFRLDVEQTINLYKTVDYAKIRAQNPYEEIEQHRNWLFEAPIERIRSNLDIGNRFIHKYGLYSKDYLQDWLHRTIAAYCDGNGRATFADFKARRFRNLYTTSVNISRHRSEIFSCETTPDVAVADAVMMSSAIPFFFEAIQFDGKSIGQGDFYIDGGALHNYPLTIFDDPSYVYNDKNFTYGINWETLGCQLYTPDNCSDHEDDIGNILQYAESVIEIMGEAQKVAVDMRAVDRWRSMSISNCCVSTTNFNIKPNENDAKYLEMVNAGKQAAHDYLKHYRLPTDRFADVKGKLANFLDIWR